MECKTIFDLIYDLTPEWIDRTEKEKNIIFNNYIILEHKWTILWWFALSDYEIDGEEWKLLECLFVAKEWKSLGYILWDEIKKHKIVFAYSLSEGFFEKLWFKKNEWQKSKSWANLFIYKKDKYSIWVIWTSWGVCDNINIILWLN